MMEGFEEYLSRFFIAEKYIPFYVKWVSYCYAFLEQSDTCLLTSEQMQSYLNYIAKSREDWQVKQAEAALRHYSYYLSASFGKARHSINTGFENHADWAELEKQTRNRLGSDTVQSELRKRISVGCASLGSSSAKPLCLSFQSMICKTSSVHLLLKSVASQNKRLFIPSATALPHTSLEKDTISGRFRNCWVMRTFKLQ